MTRISTRIGTSSPLTIPTRGRLVKKLLPGSSLRLLKERYSLAFLMQIARFLCGLGIPLFPSLDGLLVVVDDILRERISNHPERG
jgi:hypothetical protein